MVILDKKKKNPENLSALISELPDNCTTFFF